jgi:hypothetical protein
MKQINSFTYVWNEMIYPVTEIKPIFILNEIYFCPFPRSCDLYTYAKSSVIKPPVLVPLEEISEAIRVPQRSIDTIGDPIPIGDWLGIARTDGGIPNRIESPVLVAFEKVYFSISTPYECCVDAGRDPGEAIGYGLWVSGIKTHISKTPILRTLEKGQIKPINGSFMVGNHSEWNSKRAKFCCISCDTLPKALRGFMLGLDIQSVTVTLSRNGF